MHTADKGAKNMKKLLKYKNALTVIIAVVVGILLVIFGSLKSDNEKNEESLNDIPQYTSDGLESYTTSLEERIEKHIEKIAGVKNVSVLLTMESSNEKIYATDGASKDYIIIKDSSGNENAIQLSEISAQVRGIAVVCDYGNDDELRQQIITMLSSLFSIGTNRISVMAA